MVTATHYPDLGYKHASGFGTWALMSTSTPGGAGRLADAHLTERHRADQPRHGQHVRRCGRADMGLVRGRLRGQVHRLRGHAEPDRSHAQGLRSGRHAVSVSTLGTSATGGLRLPCHRTAAVRRATLLPHADDLLKRRQLPRRLRISSGCWAADTDYCGTSNAFGYIEAVGDSGTYYPDAGYKATGAAWGVTLGQTGTLAQWQAMTALTAAQRSNLATDDYNVGVSVIPSSGRAAQASSRG